MMAQYLEIKAANPDCLLFYRMGDFYELFFDDAEIASRALGIVLTKRGKHEGDDIPMCGVPIERADDYLQRLIALGHRVAVCEQLEDPAEAKKRGAKSVVRRDVVRLVTPGTITEERLLEPGRANLLLAVQRAEDRRGRRASTASPRSTFRPAPSSSSETDEAGLGAGNRAPRAERDRRAAERCSTIPRFARLVAETRDRRRRRSAREGGDARSAERRVARVLRRRDARRLRRFHPRRDRRGGAGARPMSSARRSRRAPRLAAAVAPRARREPGDRRRDARQSRTDAHALRRARRLAARDHRPDRDARRRAAARRAAGEPADRPERRSTARLDAVAFFVAAPALRDASARGARARRPISCARCRAWRSIAAARAISPRCATGSPPRARVAAHARARRRPAGRSSRDACARLGADDGALGARARRGARRRTAARPSATAASCAPALRRRARRSAGACATRAGASSPNCRRATAEEAGTRQLKIKHNNFLGYFIETPQAQGETLLQPPHSATFIHRQTMAGAMRFTTNALVELEVAHRLGRRSRAGARTRRLRAAAPARRSRSGDDLRGLGAALAEIDVAAALAELAVKRDWTRPLVDDSLAFVIEGGRHPVVEAALAARGEPFVANDCDLSGEAGEGGRIALVTGPNMAGKSTYLRQNALIAALAQMGSFVPARQRAYRRRRPAVLARRRGRRSRARPLDLHGRDGRDGGDPQSGDASARWSSSTRSAAARRPSTACRSPSPASSISTRSIARARCSPPISTN